MRNNQPLILPSTFNRTGRASAMSLTVAYLALSFESWAFCTQSKANTPLAELVPTQMVLYTRAGVNQIRVTRRRQVATFRRSRNT
jgi:hypothetical protein